MTRATLGRSIAALLASGLCVLPATAMNARPVDEWRFSVSLDGKPIGYHRFELVERGAERELRSEARFTVKVLFFDAYRYAHDNRELWRGDCLAQIEARTDDNGTRKVVRGTQAVAGFVVSTAQRVIELDSCVRTFAYWNPQILAATHLLNPQTGEYVPVRVVHLGADTLAIRGVAQATERYRLVGDAAGGERLQIDLWYSPSQEWLALESTTQDGRRLRYQLQ